MPGFVRVASVSEVAPGQAKQITVNGRVIALCNVAGTFYALDNVCPHRGGPLGDGYLNAHTLECPWHTWRFDVKTGEVVPPTSGIKVPTYEVKLEGGEVLVAV